MSKLENRLSQGSTRTRKLVTLLRFASNLPGLGFLLPYANQLNSAQQRLESARGNVVMKMDDVGDAQDAWEDFKQK